MDGLMFHCPIVWDLPDINNLFSGINQAGGAPVFNSWETVRDIYFLDLGEVPGRSQRDANVPESP
jgi:hypothetical protein